MQTTIQHLYKPPHDADGLLYAWFSAMHTRVDIILCSRKSEEELMQVINCIYDALCQLEKTANYYDPASELARVNQIASVHPVVLSEELYTMIDICLEFNKKTFGCFDVTIHSDDYNQDTIHAVHLSSKERSVFFQRAGVMINLSGFLKGYALERIKSVLKESKIEHALINMGNSSVLALGDHPSGSGWKISFGNSSHTDKSDKEQTVFLHNACLTTSGNENDGRKHIISPQNGKLIEGMKQVAVVTENGAIGEILSTSLFATSQELRQDLITVFDSLLIEHFLIGY